MVARKSNRVPVVSRASRSLIRLDQAKVRDSSAGAKLVEQVRVLVSSTQGRLLGQVSPRVSTMGSLPRLTWVFPT
jgi:hypothetical protein